MGSGTGRCGVIAGPLDGDEGGDSIEGAGYGYQSFVESRSMSGAQFLALVVRSGLGREVG